LHLDEQLGRWLGKIAKQRRAEPTLHFLLLPAIDVAAPVLPDPFEDDLCIRKVTRREHRQKSFFGVRNVSGCHVDHCVGASDEGLLDQSYVGVVENPQPLPFVRLDDEDRVVHDSFSVWPRGKPLRRVLVFYPDGPDVLSLLWHATSY